MTNWESVLNYIFENKLKYTCYDSKEIPSYFKNKEKSYLDWTLDDIEAPQNCDEFKDIAKIMGCSVSTTKSRFRLGVNQLKKLMENDYER